MNTPVLLLTMLAFLYSPCQAASVLTWGNGCGNENMPADLSDVTAVSTCSLHGFALRPDGTLIAWTGDNWGATDNIPANLSNIVEIATGFYHGLALEADGTVLTWGDLNSIGELNIPSNLNGIVDLAAGAFHSIGLRFDGTVVAWGDNEWRQTTVPRSVTNVVAVSAGMHFSTALNKDGTVSIWGGDLPAAPTGVTNVVAISAGYYHCLALRADGTVVAWGDDYFGECDVPPGATNVIAISAGGASSLALKADGTVVAWGSNSNAPAGITGVTSIVAGSSACNIALVSSNPAPVINFVPLNQTAGAGSLALFSVSASGMPPLSYQWYFGTNVLAGATNRWLALTNVQIGQSGNYTVVVSNAYGQATSQPLALNVPPSVGIDLIPAITLRGAVGSTYHIEYVEAGLNGTWQTLNTVTLTNAAQYYCDLSAIGRPKRFYRLVQVP